MEVKATVAFEGVEEALNKIGPKLARSTLRKALRAGMKPMEDEVRAKAPVDTGALRDSITTVVKTSSSQESGTAVVGPKLDGVVKKAGGDQSQTPGVYAMFVEFGVPSRNIPRNPFLRPAFDSKADEVVKTFADAMQKGLQEALK